MAALSVDSRSDTQDWTDPVFLAALAAEHSPDMLLVVDPDGAVRQISSSATRILGLRPEQEVGRAIWDFVHPDDLGAAAGASNEAARNEGYHQPALFRVLHADGGWVECEVNAETIDGPGGAWMVLAVRAIHDRDVVMERRRRIEHLIRLASVECSAVRWGDVESLVERFLQDLAGIVDAELIELAWSEGGDDMTVAARWPMVRSGRTPRSGAAQFTPLWPDVEAVDSPLHFTDDLASLPPSAARDRFVSAGKRAAVEVPLSARAPWAVLRLVFGDAYLNWDDVNVDLIRFLATTLVSTLRRCIAEEHLHEQARSDPLTGLLNRAELYRQLEILLLDAPEPGSLGVLYGDLDMFKEVNDRFGHSVGDQLLLQVSDALRQTVRDVDLVARFGGDEFVIVCPSLDSPDVLSGIMARAARAIRQIAPQEVDVRMSFGAAVSSPGVGPDDLIRLADESMYREKRTRRRLRANA